MRENTAKQSKGWEQGGEGMECAWQKTVRKTLTLPLRGAGCLEGCFVCRGSNTLSLGWHRSAGGPNAVRRMCMNRWCSVIRVLSCLFQTRFLSWLSMCRAYGCVGLVWGWTGCKHCLKPFLPASASSTALIQAKESTGFHPDFPCS